MAVQDFVEGFFSVKMYFGQWARFIDFCQWHLTVVGLCKLIQGRWLWALGWNTGHWGDAKCPGLLLPAPPSSKLEIRGGMRAENLMARWQNWGRNCPSTSMKIQNSLSVSFLDESAIIGNLIRVDSISRSLSWVQYKSNDQLKLLPCRMTVKCEVPDLALCSHRAHSCTLERNKPVRIFKVRDHGKPAGCELGRRVACVVAF